MQITNSKKTKKDSIILSIVLKTLSNPKIKPINTNININCNILLTY